MILFVEAKPNAKKNQIEILSDNTLKIRITAPPVDGKANKAIIEYLSEVFQVSKSSIKILKGDTSKYKRIEIIADDDKIQQIISYLK